MFTLLANEKEIEYKIMIEDNGEDVWFSIPNVEKIVYNLLSNSFKFTPAKGKISIQASLIDSEDDKLLLLIEVTDNGIGISKENLDRIFENYFQADPHSNVRGSGIGLSLTKRLVNLHKGNIEVQSSLENGSIFKVMIDVSEKSYSNDEKSQEIVDKEYLKNYNFITIENDVVEKVNTLMKNFNESVKTLLLVDDNEEMLKFMSDIFKPQYRILTAENGKVALDIARREYPDLVVSDVMMPVMNGFELCKKLKESFSTCHIPVILLTAKTGADDKLEGYEMGADYYIEKPFNAQILEKQVENIINTRDNNIQIFKDNPQNDISEIFSNERDSTFVKRLNKLIEENMNNPFFSVSEITKSLNISRSVLHVKCKNLLNTSVIDYIRELRMKHARDLLIKGRNISETAYAVGFSDPGYFTKVFKKQFNITPSEFVKNI
jgi:DNA-binding response OmpR family regulator